MFMRNGYCSVGFVLLLGVSGCVASKVREPVTQHLLSPLRTVSVAGECKSIGEAKSDSTWRLAAQADGKGAAVTFTPADGKNWDLSSFASVRVNIRNAGSSPVTVRAKITNPNFKDLSGTCQTASNILPGQHEELDLRIVPTPVDPGFEKFKPFLKYYSRLNVQDNTVDVTNIDALTIWLDAPTTSDAVEISKLHLTGTGTKGPVPFLPFIDKYGQYAHADWPGKIHSDADFAVRRAEEEKERADWPGPIDRNKFGGWASGPQLETKGNFRVTKYEGKWWLVDPEGKLFWSYGPTGAGFGSEITPITDRESWFTQLPPRTGETSKYYVERKSASSGYYFERDWVGFFISAVNIDRKYGPNAGEELKRITTERLRSWGFNTLGNWSQMEMIQYNRTPYVVAIHYGAPKIDDHMPDVFAPEWEKNVTASLEKHRDTTAKDPWNIGYFVDNERRWGPYARAAAVALKTLECPETSPGKIEFIKDLKAKYSTIEKLNESWGTRHASWEALAAFREEVSFAKPKNPGLEADCGNFGEKFADKYFSTCRRLVKSVAPNHMYLGARLNGHIDPSLIWLQTKYCDVISYNMYDQTPDGRMKQYEKIDFPFMITEWGIDNDPRQSPFRASGVQVAIGRKGERRDLMVQFAEAAIVHPKLVGAHFFQYRDQPISGRSDGEALLRGFLNVADTPNFELIQANRKVAYDLYKKRAEAKQSKP